MFHQKFVVWGLVLAMLAAACGGAAESSEGSEPEPFDGTCYVPYEDITCEFVCSDCADPETGEYREGSCENALPTALDHCSFQKHWPDGYKPDAG